MEALVRGTVHGLHAGRIVNVGDGGDVTAADIEFLYAFEPSLFLRHIDLTLTSDLGDQKHVRAVAIELEVLGHVLAWDGRRKRAKAFPVLDLHIELALQTRRAGVAEDRSIAQGSGT